jgi:hypothetical protein
MKNDHETLTTTELMRFLRTSYGNTKRLLDSGKIPSNIINDHGDRRILREDAIAFIRSGKKESTNA